MYRDPSEFRDRFKLYKEGKSVREIYGLPGYAPGKVGEPSSDEVFVEQMGPILYRELLYQGVENPDVVYKNLITQLAYESDRGRSRVAREQHNYGGVGWNGKTYFNYKNDADFVHDYVKLMNRRYKTAILADTLYDYAKGIKKLGYFEDTLENYSRNLIGMKSLHKAALAHKMANPELYKVNTVPVQLAKPIIAIPDATKVSTIPTILQQAIDYSDRRNTVAADIDRTIWAHNVMEDVKGAYQVPIWESPSLPALTPVEYDVTPLKTYAGGKVAGKDGTKMQWDADAGVWRQVMDDPYADVFNNLVVTPNYIRPKFEYETNPNYQQPNKNEVVKPDETLWTRQQVEKVNNTRTWMSDAADAMHAVGEGAMVASTFAAPEIEGLVYPAYQGVRAAIILAAKSNAPVMQYLRYPIGKAIYGYDAQFPTLYRKIKSLPTEPQDGVIQISNPVNRFMFSDTKQESPIITNFTYDAPVRKHSNGNWDSGFTLAIPGKKLLGKNVISTEPSDLFTYGDNIRVPLKDVTLISGNQKELDLANLYGYKTITSPKLLQLYQQGDSPGVKQELSGYAKEVEKTTRLFFKSPTKNDVDFMNFVLQPKIKGEVYDPNMLDYLIRNEIGEFGDRIGNAELRSYLLDPDRWKYILYDPATHAEYNFRNSMGIDLKKGFRDGKIAIKPSKRGTFTAAAKKHGASVREFESRVLKNPEKYSKAMVKKARFSRNARSWKH